MNFRFLMVIFCMAAGFLPGAHVEANTKPAKPIILTRVVESRTLVKVDGILDESVWEQLEAIDDFLVIDPDTLKNPYYRTEVRIFYTGKGIYVGVRNDMPEIERVKRLSSRDTELNRDALTFSVDPTGRGLFGYQFTVNLGGSVADASILPERDISLDWDGAWWSGTSETDEAWYAELFLPWTLFAMPEQKTIRSINIFVERKLGARQESLGWPPLTSTQAKFLSGFQPVLVEGINPKSRLTWYPFMSSLSDFKEHDSHYKVGADFYWRPSPETLFSATVNPDFGQVESDKAVVNLSAFETFFEEKRDFFVEGQEIFETGHLQLLNTRRIGEPFASSLIEFSDGESVSGRDEASELIGATKLTHQRGNWRYGFLGAFEKDSKVDITDSSGDTHRRNVEGRNFGVIRALYENTDTGYKALGIFSSHVLHENGDAHVQAVDSHYRSDDGTWQWNAQLLRTDTETVSDASVDYGLWTDINWVPRRGSEHNLRLLSYGENMNINNLGFLSRNDFRGFVYKYTGTNASNPRFKNIETTGLVVQGYNHDGLMINQGFSLGRKWLYHDNNSFRFFSDFSPARWDDRNSRGNGNFRIKGRWFGKVEYKTDSSKKLSFEFSGTGRHEDLQGLQRTATASVRYIANYYTDLKFSLEYQDREGWLVHRGGTNFTTYDALHWEPRFDGSLFFNDKQHLALSVQWVGVRAGAAQRYTIADGDHLRKVLVDPSADDFSLSDIIVQLRFQWNIAPLSDLFIVYTRGGTSHFSQRKAFDSLFEDAINQPTKEQLVVKLRYRFGG